MNKYTIIPIVIALSFACGLVLSGAAIAGSSGGSETVTLVRASSDPIREAIDADIDEARAKRVAGEPGHARMLRKAAAELAAIGNASDAIQLLSEVIDHQESIVDHREALRQQGQYFRQLGNLTAALRCFERQATLFAGAPSTGSLTGFASGQLSRAEILCSMGAHQQSLDVLGDVLDVSHAQELPEPLVASVYKWQSINNERLGRHAEAAGNLDDLLARLPEYGMENGRIISLHLRRLRLKYPERHGDPYWQALKQVWSDERLLRHPEILRVGDALLQSANLRGDPVEHTLFAEEIAGLVETQRDEWLAAVEDLAERTQLATKLDAAREQALIGMQSSAFNADRLDLLIYALEELQKFEDDHVQRQHLQDQIDGYRDRL